MPVKRRPAMPSENASDGILLWAYNTDAHANKNQYKARRPETVQMLPQCEAALYWFKFRSAILAHLWMIRGAINVSEFIVATSFMPAVSIRPHCGICG